MFRKYYSYEILSGKHLIGSRLVKTWFWVSTFTVYIGEMDKYPEGTIIVNFRKV